MGWLPAPEDVPCSHVYCMGLSGCAYQPPALGPELPRSVTASDGSLWWRDGQIFYWQNSSPGAPPRGRRLATWRQVRRLADGGPRYPHDEGFPEGPFIWGPAA